MLSMIRRWLRRAWWLPVAIPATLTGAAWLIQVLVSDAFPDWARAALIVAGTLSAILGFALPTRQIHVERASRAAERAAYSVKLHDILIPVALKVGEIVGSVNVGSRREGQASLRQMVVDFTANNIGPTRSRACFFELLNSGSGPRKLERRAWSGRNKEPRLCFEDGTPAGISALKIVDDLDAVLVPDAQTASVPGWTPGVSEYRTFICAAVFAAGKPLGILTVDSLSPGDLTKDDLDLARLLAHLLATGLTR